MYGNFSTHGHQDIFCMEDCAHVCKLKIEITQEMIQIQHPSKWNMDQIKLISSNIKRIEYYNMLK